MNDAQVSDDGSGEGCGSGDSGSERDTDAEIAQAYVAKSRKTRKRKRRATSPVRFGVALESLLHTDAPDGVPAPMSLRPGVARQNKAEKIERSTRKILDEERREREEKGHVRDVIGGWGAEGERALRKVAQRGVITLFNAIQQSQAATEAASDAVRAVRGTGKATLAAPDPDRNDRAVKKKAAGNATGMGRDAVLDQASFLELIRAGGVVSKT